MKVSQAIEAAKIIAMQIVNAEISAYDGAKHIWKEILDKLEVRIPDALWPFKSNASAIEDYLFNAQDGESNFDVQIADCKNKIIEAAKSLLLSG